MRDGFADSRYAAAILFGVLVLYAPFVGGGWMTDDFIHAARAQEATAATALTSADPFGFYRPLPQLSFAVESRLWPDRPVAARLVNVALHACVIAAAFLVATRLLTPRAALLATVAFALTPKAHGIAVLWMSARPELLAALGSLLAVAAWISWVRSARPLYLFTAVACCTAAMLSKESALLLPAVLAVTPAGARLPPRTWTYGVAWLAIPVAAALCLRIAAGAMLPGSTDAHYTLAWSPERWFISLENYLPRSLPSALGLLVVTLAVRLAARCTPLEGAAAERLSTRTLALYACAWFVACVIPVLPLVARSELYVYLAGFGFCLLAGHVAGRLLAGCRRRTVTTAMVIYVAAAGAYLVSRNKAIHDDLMFSRRLVEAIAADPLLAAYKGAVVIVPADGASERSLRDAVGGYITPVLHYALKRTDVYGWASYEAPPSEASPALRLICELRDGVPAVRREDDAPR